MNLFVTLQNIQGFRGTHTYEINDLVTIINSKHNGVGKTTLFDCLRFLCDSASVDKDEQEFYLNMEEKEALFSVKVNDVTHGFAFVENQPPLFFRAIDGEELERSSDNFPNVGADIGILQINGVLLNLFSKEVNLFSNSKASENYQLVKALTTHEQTEETLELMIRSEEIAKQNLNRMRMEKKLVDSQVENLPYYSNTVEMEELLNNPFYEQFEDALESTLRLLNSIHPVSSIEVDSKVLEDMFVMNDLINQIMPVDNFSVDVKPLEFMQEVISLLNTVEPIEHLELSTEPLDLMLETISLLETIVSTDNTIELSVKPIESLIDVMNAIDQVVPVEPIEVSVQPLQKISEVCVEIAKIITQLNQVEYHEKQLSRLRESVASVRVSCPIREEVYLIDGKCHY